jgi:hypothetical protein
MKPEGLTEDYVKDIYVKADQKIKEEYEKEKSLGFDYRDSVSVDNFNIDYTPVGDTIIVKFIIEVPKEGEIITPKKYEDRKAVVLVPGLLITTLEKGDIISMKPSDRNNPLPPTVDREFNGIKFQEISYYSVAGIYRNRKDVMERVNRNDVNLR